MSFIHAKRYGSYIQLLDGFQNTRNITSFIQYFESFFYFRKFLNN